MFNLFDSILRSLLPNSDSESYCRQSFPHAFSGGSTGLTTGETLSGPPIKTFEGDNFGDNY